MKEYELIVNSLRKQKQKKNNIYFDFNYIDLNIIYLNTFMNISILINKLLIIIIYLII